MNTQIGSGEKARSIIAARWPEVGKQLDRTDNAPLLTLYEGGRYPTLEANGVRLSSAWDPDAEAEQQLEPIHSDATSATIFGIGMGYLPLNILESHLSLNTLTIVPLDLALFSSMIDCIDMTSWLDNPKVALKLPDTIVELPEIFAVTPPTLQLADASAERLRDLIRQKLAEDHCESFQQSREGLLSENIQQNLTIGKDDADVSDLFNTCKAHQTVVTIGAGPSLNCCIEEITQLQKGGSILIAVDAALKALLLHDLMPDYVVTIDPLETVKEFLDVNNHDLSHCGLVYFPSACSSAIENWPACRYAATGTHKRYDYYRDKRSASRLFSAGCVMHPAIDLAVQMGAREIYLAGADFGYPFESTHAQGVSFQVPAKQVIAAGYSVRNYHNDNIPSCMNLISYFRDQERYITQFAPQHVHFKNLGYHSAKISSVSPVATNLSYAA